MTGWQQLARLILRRDRLRIGIWTLSIVAMALSSAIGVRNLYKDPAELEAFARTVGDNVSVIAFNGPAYDIGTLGGRVAFEASTQLAIAIALMAILSMTRHTRAEEESGRAELLRAAPTGPHAGLTAALVVTCAESMLIGALVSVSLVAADFAAAGSVALGAIVAVVGIAFAAIGALSAQVTEHARAASGIGIAALGVAFGLRAVGDSGTPWLRWLSPIGIAQLVHAYSGERWWPPLVLLVASAGIVGVAVWLASRRDLGAGLVATPPGPPHAVPSLGRPFGLALRLQRGTIAAWSIGLFVFGAVMGSVAEGAEDLIGDNEGMRDILVSAGIRDIVDSFLGTILLMLALTACGLALQSAMRLRSEELAGRGELVLSTGVPRQTWFGAHVAVTLLASSVSMVLAGLGVGLAHGLRIGDLGQVPRLAAASLVQVPAVVVLAGLAFLLLGVAPRWLQLAWAPFAYAVVVGIFGDLLSLPSWLTALTPFEHVPMVPAEPFEAMSLVVAVAVAALCVLGGLIAYQQRDAA